MEKSKRSLTVRMKHEDDFGVKEESNLGHSVRASGKEDSQRTKTLPDNKKRDYENEESSMHEDSCIGINYAHMFSKCFRSLHTLTGLLRCCLYTSRFHTSDLSTVPRKAWVPQASVAPLGRTLLVLPETFKLWVSFFVEPTVITHMLCVCNRLIQNVSVQQMCRLKYITSTCAQVTVTTKVLSMVNSSPISPSTFGQHVPELPRTPHKTAPPQPCRCCYFMWAARITSPLRQPTT